MVNASIHIYMESRNKKDEDDGGIDYLLKDHAGCTLPGDMAQNGHRDDGDDGQRNNVREREKRGEDASGYVDRVVIAFAVHDAVRPQYRDVDGQHQHPDERHRRQNIATGSDRRRANAMHDRHVANDGDEYQRVDGHVRGHVDQVVHQFADGVAKRPAGGRLLVGGERRHDADEAQVRDGEIQQQEIGDRSHAAVRQDDVDDEAVSGGAEQRDDSVLRRVYQLEQEPFERALFFRVFRSRRVEVGEVDRRCQIQRVRSIIHGSDAPESIKFYHMNIEKTALPCIIVAGV